MSKSLRRAVLMLLLSATGLTGLYAQNNNFWQDVSASTFTKNESQKKVIVPTEFRSLKLNTQALLDALSAAPVEFTAAAQTNPLILSLPMPDGSMSRFSVVYSQTMDPALAAQFPNIKTFNGQGIDDPSASLKMDWTEFGFHAQVRSASADKTFYIDPYVQGETTQYISYFKKDLPVKKNLEAGVIEEQIENLSGLAQRTDAGFCFGSQLRTYRLAVACTGEYAVAVGATTVAQALSAITTTVNRVNGIFESELSIRLQLVGNNNLVVFTNATTDPFTGNNNANTLINESQTVIDANIGNGNYDIGHTFSTGAGGLAQSPAVCLSSGKARGVTGSNSPSGDGYDVDFVAHEMGHQFGGSHTFNAATGGCGGGNRSAANSVEPGSGITIMGYAGLCDDVGVTNDLANNSIPYFHAHSQNQILTYVTASAGATCGTPTNTGNAIPVVNAGADYVIPRSTPFMLTGSATDVNDNQVLTYSWEEIDNGGVSGSDWNSGNKPFFRSFAPNPHPYRSFPLLSSVVNNTTLIGEFLPASAQVLNFRLTARDNRSGGAGVCSDDMIVTVSGTAGPFQVTTQWGAETWTAGGTATISWDVASTNIAPINATNVSIAFSADGGLTFPYTILASTANDGTETITVPSIKTTKGRIMIKGVNNVFYNVNSANITINTPCAAEGATVSPATTVTAQYGTAPLNLNLTPQYTSNLSASGTLTSSTPTSNLHAYYTNSSACATFSNTTPYVTYPFSVSQNGTYTFTFTGTSGIVLHIYNNSYTPSSCTNFLGSNVAATTSGTSTSLAYQPLSVNLNTTGSYVLVVQYANSTLPATYNVSATSAPAGGVLLSGSGSYTNPGAGFSYSYVVVRNSTNLIVSIGTSDMTNSSTFPPGQYTVYGLSHASSISSLSSYVGQSLTNLLTQIQNNPTTFCASLSKNSILVNVTGTFPVQFTALRARKNGEKVNLDWGTVTEQNSSHFIVQRSANGTEFNAEIGRVAAAGNSTTLLNYRLDDIAPLKGWNYYRIKQVDLDGKFIYSNIAAVNFAKDNSLMVLYPNPTKDLLNIEYTSARAGKLELQVIDSKGAVMMKQNMAVTAGTNLETINVSMLSQGMYILRYQDASGNISFTKFIKQ